MRVYISVDMEGIAGIVHEDQTNPVDSRCAAEYARGRALMTAEANAAVEGALAAGAELVLVNDSQRRPVPPVPGCPRIKHLRPRGPGPQGQSGTEAHP